MKALTLHQPWASAIAHGVKKHETRSWKPPALDIGTPIAIHAGKSFGPGGATAAREWIQAAVHYGHRDWLTEAGAWNPVLGAATPELMVQGAVVCTVALADVERTEVVGTRVDILDFDLGDYSKGRFAWRLEELHRLAEPVPLRGAQGLFNVPLDVEAAIYEQEMG